MVETETPCSQQSPQTPTPETSKNEKIAILLVLGATIIWGSQYILMKQGVTQVPPMLFQALRHLFAFFCFLPFLNRFKKIDKITFEGSIISAIVIYFLYIFLVYGLELTTSNKGAFLLCLYVIFTPPICFLLLKIRPKIHHLQAVIVGVLGMSIMVFGNSNSNNLELAPNLGDVLVIIAAFFNAVQIVLVEKYVHKVDLITFIMTQLLFLCIFFFVSAFLLGEFNDLTPIPLSAWWILVYLGVIASTITLIIQTWAQKYLESTRAALLYSLEPVFATGFGVILGGETITLAFILGAGLIMTGILWSSKKK